MLVALAKQILHSFDTVYHTKRPISPLLELLDMDRLTNWEINMCIFGTYCLRLDKNQLSHLHDTGFEYLIVMTFPQLLTLQSWMVG
jgi:hypothetical protein